MLYDPNWGKDKSAHRYQYELALGSFRAYCESRGATVHYRYQYKHCCAVGQWLKAIGTPALIDTDWRRSAALVMLDDIASKTPHRFGALAGRLREHERAR